MEPTVGIRVDSLSALAAMAAEERTAARRMRLALAAAVGLHLVLFVIHWPSFASDRSDSKPPRVTVLRLNDYVLKPPEEIRVAPPQIERIPIPDPTPQDPEPSPERIRPLPDVAQTIVEPPWDQVVPPPPPDPPSRGEVRVFRDISPPAKLFAPDPVYPKAALAARISGSVELECLIDREGRVADVKVLRPGPLGMTEAAVEAVRQWRFAPSTLGGTPVEVVYVLTVRFTLPR